MTFCKVDVDMAKIIYDSVMPPLKEKIPRETKKKNIKM